MKKTAPFLAEVRKVVVREGKVSVSFEGMNSWYAVPAHLEAIIRRAADERHALAITTTTDAVVTAERSRRRTFASYSGPSLECYEALGQKKRRRDNDYGGI